MSELTFDIPSVVELSHVRTDFFYVRNQKSLTVLIELRSTSTTEHLLHVQNTQVLVSSFAWIEDVCSLYYHLIGWQVHTPC